MQEKKEQNKECPLCKIPEKIIEQLKKAKKVNKKQRVSKNFLKKFFGQISKINLFLAKKK